ncbi:hypothetical protein CK203_097785 [Vitis vinifera]|uniref:Uncharacterized protein n=1 Tax=Vitis vinifera TaxID=29760 RepID=A0A438D505_VITVI|nr:hypothetical protein CK203_097785 [Vitis vinifera]
MAFWKAKLKVSALYEIQSDSTTQLSIFQVHLDRPEAKNAIGKEMLRGLQNTFVAIIIGVG